MVRRMHELCIIHDETLLALRGYSAAAAQFARVQTHVSRVVKFAGPSQNNGLRDSQQRFRLAMADCLLNIETGSRRRFLKLRFNTGVSVNVVFSADCHARTLRAWCKSPHA